MSPQRYSHQRLGFGRSVLVLLLELLGLLVMSIAGIATLAASFSAMPGVEESTTEILSSWLRVWF